MKILKNTTLTDIELVEVGLTIPASGQIEVNTESFLDLAAENSVLELTPLINSGDVIVNDGSSDLSAADGLNYILYPDDASSSLYDNTISGLAANTIQKAIDEIASNSTDNNFAYFAIWAEENAGIANGQREWSFGNGATGDIGIVLPVDAQLVAVSYNADVAGTNSEVAVVQNSSTQVATTGPQSGEDGFNELVTPIQFNAGDRVGFQTVIGGGATDVRVTAWFRVPTNILIDETEIDHGLLDGLLDDDHPQYLNETRHDALPFDNPHNVNQTQVGLGNVDNTSDLDKPISTATQAALDLKYDASNPDNFQDDTQVLATAQAEAASAVAAHEAAADPHPQYAETADLAPVALSGDHGDLIGLGDDDHPQYLNETRGDIRYYTKTQLDGGQLDNRYYTETEIDAQQLIQDNAIAQNALDISNHINDAVDAHDATAISYDNSTSGLSATEVQAAIDEVDGDLDTHIADTNNPHVTTFTQVVAADSGTDITTAEAEELTDGSTTQLHFHRELVDETGTDRVDVLNGGDIQISNYPQTRNDTTSNDEKVLTTDGSGNIVLRRVLPFYDSIKKISNAVDEEGINQTTTLEDWLTLNVNIPETGNYDIDWFYTWSLNDTGQDFISEILLDGVPISTYSQHVQEPKDSGGSGVTLLIVGGGTIDSGTNQRHKTVGFEPERNLTAGPHTITIQWAGSSNNDRAAIYEGAIRIKRVT